MALYKQFTLPVLTEDADGICKDQTTSGAADLDLDGDLVSGGVATAAAAQQVLVEGSGNNNGITFTITGKDADGNVTSEVLTGSNGGTAKTTAYFVTVTAISASGAVTGNVECGWLATHGMVTNSYPTSRYNAPFNASLTFNLTAGSMTLSAQWTVDSPADSYTNGYSTDADWRNTVGLTAVTADDVSNIAFPVMAIRFIETVGSTTGEGTATYIQSN